MNVVWLVLLYLGVFFMSVSAIGVVRLPDIYHRVHAPTKAATLGLIFLLLSAMIALPDPTLGVKCLLAVIFFFSTAPVGAQVLSHLAYMTGISPSPQLLRDDYKKYLKQKHQKTRHQNKPGAQPDSR